MKKDPSIHMNKAENNLEFSEINIDIKQVFFFIKKYALKACLISLLAALLAGLISYAITPTYRAQATLLIEAEEAKVVSIEEVYGINSSNNEYLKTQFEMLKSTALAERVTKSLKLVDTPYFQEVLNKKSLLGSLITSIKNIFGMDEVAPDEDLERSQLERVSNIIAKGLSVSPVRGTQLVKLSFESTHRHMAKNIVNTFARLYIQSNLEAKASIAQRAIDMLSERLGGLEDRLEASELALREYREQEGLIDLQGVTTLVSKQLNELTSQIVDVRRQKAELEALSEQVVDENGALSLEELESVSSILNDTLVQHFKEAEAEADAKLEELAQRYGPKHPEMLAARADLDVATRKYTKQLKNVAEGISQEYSAAKRKERRLLKELESGKNELQEIRRKEFALTRLQREVNSNRQLYNTFFKRVKETTETVDLATANARVVDAAKVPLTPVKPRKALIVVAVFIICLMLSFGVALLIDILDNTFKTTEDIESKLNAPLLGILPKLADLGGEKDNLSRAFYDEDHKKYAEAVRTIRTGLQLAGIDKPLQVTMVTSSVPGEGKSTLSMNLAHSLGLNEKVLLIDADMRRPSVGKKMGFAVGTPGLANLIAGNASNEACIQSVEGIDVMVAGAVPPNPLELLSTEKFGNIVKQLRESYDRIIIDSPPTQAVSDALILSTHSDGLIYVVKAASTSVHLAQAGTGDVLQAGAPLTGVVLNQIDLDKQSSYSYAYTGYYENEET